MEQQLLSHSFITGDNYNIADIALFAYTHVADEGGFSLEDHAAIRAWIERVNGRRPCRYSRMDRTR
jgi:glutathione S-transferase